MYLHTTGIIRIMNRKRLRKERWTLPWRNPDCQQKEKGCPYDCEWDWLQMYDCPKVKEQKAKREFLNNLKSPK